MPSSSILPSNLSVFWEGRQLTPQEAKLLGASLLGLALASGTAYLVLRRPSSSSTNAAGDPSVDDRRQEHKATTTGGEDDESTSRSEIIIDSLEELLQYNTGSIFCDLVTRIITPKVSAVRVTSHGSRLPALPRAVCNLVGLTELNISGNSIEALPCEISRLAGLRTLDISGNTLRELPSDIGALTQLRRLNAMDNRLEVLPDSIGRLTNIESLGLKNNKLRTIPDTIGHLKNMRELYLTGNEIETLPERIGGCTALVKLQASHNALTSLPESLGALPNLELLRVACCNIDTVPLAVAESKTLAWLSLASNPFGRPTSSPRRGVGVPVVSFEDISIERKVGDGASGEVFEGRWKNDERVAIKLFRSDRSPDGHSRDEIAVACAVGDRNLVRVLARIEEPLGLVMEYVEGRPLAEKPDASSLLRCRWKSDASFGLAELFRVLVGVSSAIEQMHGRGVVHGDVYAHNVLAGEDDLILCDYGASFAYPRGTSIGNAVEGHDIRAFGTLMRDVIGRLDIGFEDMETALSAQKELLLLIQQCITGSPSERPRMSAISRKLKSMQKSVSQSASNGNSRSTTPKSDSRLAVRRGGVGERRNGLSTAR